MFNDQRLTMAVSLFEPLKKHNAMSSSARSNGSPPAVKVRTGDDLCLGFTVHKWSVTEPPKGDFLAIAILGRFPELAIHKQDLKLKYADIISQMPEIDSIEAGDVPDFIFIFKSHSNQWRPVKPKKNKWVYQESLDKTKPCNVERIITMTSD